MIRTNQSTFGPPDSPLRLRGDCYSACLASILEVPLSQVPRFAEMDDGVDRYGWIQNWLSSKSLFLVSVGASEEFLSQVAPSLGLCILTGKAYGCDYRHSVVSLAGRVVHDPWGPDAPGLSPHEDADPKTHWALDFLVPFDPTRVRAHSRPDGLLEG